VKWEKAIAALAELFETQCGSWRLERKAYVKVLLRSFEVAGLQVNEYKSCHNCLVDSAIALLVVMILVWSAKLAGENSLCQRFF
jgi:hypothetical protein